MEGRYGLEDADGKAFEVEIARFFLVSDEGSGASMQTD